MVDLVVQSCLLLLLLLLPLLLSETVRGKITLLTQVA